MGDFPYNDSMANVVQKKVQKFKKVWIFQSCTKKKISKLTFYKEMKILEAFIYTFRYQEKSLPVFKLWLVFCEDRYCLE